MYLKTDVLNTCLTENIHTKISLTQNALYNYVHVYVYQVESR